MQTQAILKAFLCVFLFSQGWLYSMDSGIPEGNSFFSILDDINLRAAKNPHIPLCFTLSQSQNEGMGVYFLMGFHDAIAIHSVTVNGETIEPFPDVLRPARYKATPISTRFPAVQYPVLAHLIKLDESRLKRMNQFRSPPIANKPVLSDGPYFLLYGIVASEWPHISIFLIPQDVHTIEIIYSGIYQKEDREMHYGTEKYRLLLLNRENAANRDAK